MSAALRHAYSGVFEGLLHAGAGVTLPVRFRIGVKWEQTLPDIRKEFVPCMMDSPSQGVFSIPGEARLEEGQFVLKVADIGVFRCAMRDEPVCEMKGEWKQAGRKLELMVTRVEGADVDAVEGDGKHHERKRTQLPQPPFPYEETEVRFEGGDGQAMAGTLSIPSDPSQWKATVVLVSGSGPQTRNQNVFGHPTFHVLADHLARHGIASLRYDKRGIGDSDGDALNATIREYTADAAAALAFLHAHHNLRPVGILGHSEGGLVAPAALLQSRAAPDAFSPSFLVLLGAMAETGRETLQWQREALFRAMEMPEDYARALSEFSGTLLEAGATASDVDVQSEAFMAECVEVSERFARSLPRRYREFYPDEPEHHTEFVREMQKTYSPWLRSFYPYDPRPVLREVARSGLPVLALNGSKDLQVGSHNLENMRAVFREVQEDPGFDGAKGTLEAIELEGLNHIFQECFTGLPAEYEEISESFSPIALKTISDWINKVARA